MILEKNIVLGLKNVSLLRNLIPEVKIYIPRKWYVIFYSEISIKQYSLLIQECICESAQPGLEGFFLFFKDFIIDLTENVHKWA